MKTSLSIALVAASSLVVVTLASAAAPTQDDFDACNRVAETEVASPSASPQTAVGPGGATGPMGPGPGGAPAPAINPPARTYDATPRAQSDASAPTAKEPARPSSSQLSGMLDRGMMDPAYKSAYQRCMKQRGF